MPNQLSDEGLQRLGCLLSIMLPYDMASWLLGQWNGVTLSASTLWNKVQQVGEKLEAEVEKELQQLE